MRQLTISGSPNKNDRESLFSVKLFAAKNEKKPYKSIYIYKSANFTGMFFHGRFNYQIFTQRSPRQGTGPKIRLRRSSFSSTRGERGDKQGEIGNGEAVRRPPKMSRSDSLMLHGDFTSNDGDVAIICSKNDHLCRVTMI